MKNQVMTLTQYAKTVFEYNSKALKIDRSKLNNLKISNVLFQNGDGSYEDPYEGVWNYLFDDANFNCLSDEIKRSIDIKCNNSNVDYSDYLKQALIQNTDITEKEYSENYRKKVRKWLDGKNAFISRENAFRVCFALGLDPYEATDFLFKGCQQSGLNIRSAREAIVFFCLLHNSQKDSRYSYSDIERLYGLCEPFLSASNANPIPVTDMNNTTQRLVNIIENIPDNSFNDEDSFIKFIRNNAESFIDFSKNAFYNYNKIKLELIGLAIQNEINLINDKKKPGTQMGITAYSKYKILLENFCSYIIKTDVDRKNNAATLKAKISELSNFEENEINTSAAKKNGHLNKLYFEIQDLIAAVFDKDFQSYYENVTSQCLEDEDSRATLYECIPENGFWIYLLPETFDTENINRFGRKIQKNFSQFRQIKFGLEPKARINDQTGLDVVRKQIILMKSFCLIFANENEMHRDDYYSGIIDRILDDCGFYPLYPRQYFDWLILITLRILNEFDSYHALLFLRDALAFESDGKE